MAKETTIEQWATRVTLLAALGLGGTSLGLQEKYTGPTPDEIVAHENRLATIENDLKNLVANRETMSKHWKLHSWAKDQINELRFKQDLGVANWPEF